MNEEPDASERGQILLFVGFLLLCGTVVAIVAIAHTKKVGWTAVGAVGASAQALAVAVGLPIAVHESRERRRADHRGRRLELLDDLEETLHERFDPVRHRVEAAVRTARNMIEARDEEREQPGHYNLAAAEKRYDEAAANYKQVAAEFEFLASKIQRRAAALGQKRTVPTLQLQVASLGFPSWALSDRFDAAQLKDLPSVDDLRRANNAFAAMAKLIQDLIDADVPEPAVRRGARPGR